MYTKRRIVKEKRAFMEEHNTPQEELKRENGQEEYSFMQEVIKDEADSGKRLKSNIVKTIGYGILLGVAASITFCAFKPWLENHFNNNPIQVEIPKDEEEKSGDESTEEKSGVLGADAYRQVLQTLNTTASEAKKSMVVVSRFTGAVAVDKKNGAENGTSGVIIADNGRELLVLSNILSLRKGESVQIIFADGKSYKAVEKMKDNNLNLCVYAVMREEIAETTWSGITTAEIGSSSSVGNGGVVIALGKPFGADEAIAYGIIKGEKKYAELADGHYRLLSTDITAETNIGSGVILNRYGQLIGVINPSIIEENNTYVSGYGISDIKDIIELLSNGSAIPYTGIYGMDVTDKLMEKGMPKGVYVKEVAPDSPAMAAGIQSGDVIVGIDGENIGSLSNYHNILMRKSEGSEIKLQGCRQGAGEEYVDIDFKVTVSSKNKD